MTILDSDGYLYSGAYIAVGVVVLTLMDMLTLMTKTLRDVIYGD